jgi:hypothetical protein
MRLAVYFVTSYLVAYLVHFPVHNGSPTDPVIPAMVPWGIASLVAVLTRKQSRYFVAGWTTLAVASSFFLIPHVIRHG